MHVCVSTSQYVGIYVCKYACMHLNIGRCLTNPRLQCQSEMCPPICQALNIKATSRHNKQHAILIYVFRHALTQSRRYLPPKVPTGENYNPKSVSI